MLAFLRMPYKILSGRYGSTKPTKGLQMIKHLTGIHETVAYRPDTQICLYNNDESL